MSDKTKNAKTVKSSSTSKSRSSARARQIGNAALKECPWCDILRNEQMSDDDDQRFGRYTSDLVHGLETIRKYPQGVTIFGSARLHETSKYYQKAYELGAKLAQHSHTVITGGGPGIMEAANRGAFENHGRSVGLNIYLATEQDLNPWTTDSMEFHYFFARKVMMTFSGKAFVFFPGGFGTMDEFSEVLELVHTGKTPHAPIFLFGSEFWSGLDKWFAGPMSKLHLIETGNTDEMNEMPHLAKAADYGLVHNARDLYTITDDVDEILKVVDQTSAQDVDYIFEQVTNGREFKRHAKADNK